jgi:short-subunit dehydrogenase
MQIADSVIIITGASMGIGEATARLLAAKGAKLALAARSADKLEGLAAELRARDAEVIVVPTDMTDQEAVQRLVQTTVARFGRVDALINNAGVGLAGTVAKVDIADLRRAFDINVFGPVYAIQAVAPEMRRTGGGVIVNLSSMVSFLNLPIIGTYAATKYALNALSHAARLELLRDNIRVVTLYPGRTDTPFYANTLGGEIARRARQMMQGSRGADAPATPAKAPAAASAQSSRPGARMNSAEDVAWRIARALEREPRDQFMDTGSALFARGSSLVTPLLDRVIGMGMLRAQEARNRAAASATPAPPTAGAPGKPTRGFVLGAIAGALTISASVAVALHSKTDP